LYTEICSETINCDTSKGLYCPNKLLDRCDCPVKSDLFICDCVAGFYWDYDLISCSKLNLL
jgi:hypothetical protein